MQAPSGFDLSIDRLLKSTDEILIEENKVIRQKELKGEPEVVKCGQVDS